MHPKARHSVIWTHSDVTVREAFAYVSRGASEAYRRPRGVLRIVSVAFAIAAVALTVAYLAAFGLLP